MLSWPFGPSGRRSTHPKPRANPLPAKAIKHPKPPLSSRHSAQGLPWISRIKVLCPEAHKAHECAFDEKHPVLRVGDAEGAREREACTWSGGSRFSPLSDGPFRSHSDREQTQGKYLFSVTSQSSLVLVIVVVLDLVAAKKSRTTARTTTMGKRR
jgi:hypothetical protein